MTASQHPSKSIGPGQRRLITYGKTPRKRQTGTTVTESAPSYLDEARSDPRGTAISSSPRPTPRATHNADVRTISRTQSQSQEQSDAQQRKRKRSSPSSIGTITSRPKGALSPGPTHATRGESRRTSSDGSEIPAHRTLFTNSGNAAKELTKHSQAGPVQYRAESGRNSGNDEKTHPLSPPKSRRPRLIDTLAAQRAASPELETESTLSTPSTKGRLPPTPSHRSTIDRDTRLRLSHRSRDTPKNGKIKFTYSQSRALAGEAPRHDEQSDSVHRNDPLLPASLVPSSPGLDVSASYDFDDDLEEEEGSKNAIRSAHELRRAGAHSRFADEMEDLLSRIGTPGCGTTAMRRNALLELTSKLQNEEFATQFRDHAARDNIARNIGDEEDIISGFALAAVLVVFLTSGAAPHLLQQLGDYRLGKLLRRLLRVEDDIDLIASQKHMNLSKMSCRSISNVKGIIVDMDIWHGYQLGKLSPRIMALQLLDIFIRYSDPRFLQEATGDVSADINGLGEHYAQGGSERDVEYALVLSVLEAQSSALAHPADGSMEVLARPSLVSKLLQKTLDRWPTAQGKPEVMTLRLAINTTNTGSGAAALHDSTLLSTLATCVGEGFKTIQKTASARRSQDVAYENLLLLLAVMINVVEYWPPARLSVGQDSVESLVGFYSDHRLSAGEVSSEEKSELGVAFGYLAVLLGYLSLPDSTGEHLRVFAHGEDSSTLVKTIQDFIDVYRNVDGRVHEMESLVQELQKHPS